MRSNKGGASPRWTQFVVCSTECFRLTAIEVFLKLSLKTSITVILQVISQLLHRHVAVARLHAVACRWGGRGGEKRKRRDDKRIGEVMQRGKHREGKGE